MKRRPVALITGVAGFAGSHLAEELLRADFKVVGTILEKESTVNLASIQKNISLERLDIINYRRCTGVVKKIHPDFIFHLAAIASVGRSFEAERQTLKVNFEGTVNMLEAARHIGRLKKFIFVSSADCFGHFSPKTKTLREDQPLNPVSPYAIAKAAAEHICLYYARRHGMPITVARSFNHAGPRQSPDFVVASFASQIAQIELGKKKAFLRVGDLSSRRDFSDVRDIVAGYRHLALRGKSGEVYHLCSGRSLRIQTILDLLLTLAEKDITVRIDKARLRRADIPVLRGSNDKAIREIDYRVNYSLKQTLYDTLEFWRDRERR